jgi:hypothetical protein
MARAYRSLPTIPRFVHIRRLNLLEQAISFAIAEQTHQWTSLHQQAGEPRMDFGDIALRVQSAANATSLLEQYFCVLGLEPARVHYEELCAAPREVTVRVERDLGLEPAEPDLGRVRLSKQGNATNEAFHRAFVEAAREGVAAAVEAAQGTEQREGRSLSPEDGAEEVLDVFAVRGELHRAQLPRRGAPPPDSGFRSRTQSWRNATAWGSKASISK